VVVHALAGSRPRVVDLVVIGSHCVGLDLLLGLLHERGFTSKLVTVGSEAGLAAAKRGACDLAGIHLLDPDSRIYNRPFISDALELVPGYGRLQGVLFRRDDGRFSAVNDADGVRAAAASEGVSMINRNRGSGTRLLIDDLLGELRPPGYSIEASSHHAVAAAIEQGRADFGVAIDVVARDRALGFLPLTEERYDFVIPRSRHQRPAVEAFVSLLDEPRTRLLLEARGFLV
jgi:putative molybdopterin biosynthesis protein